MKPVRIVIIAKAPVPGYTKTRLMPALGAAGAAALAQKMLQHAVRIALDAGVGPVELCAAPDQHHPAWASLAPSTGLTWSDQGAGDLGARMGRAAQRTLLGGESVLLIGTDCPQMSAQHLRDAADGLRDHDAALVPTVDGGYVLLGLNQFHASLFNLMPWSTATVATETRRRLALIPWTVRLHPALRDVDEPEDLHWLPPSWKPGADPVETESTDTLEHP